LEVWSKFEQLIPVYNPNCAVT